MNTQFDLYSRPMMVGFDGEGDGSESSGSGDASGTPAPAASGAGNKPKVFSQDDVNKYLAEDRRKHAEKIKSLEDAYKQVTEGKSLTEQEKVQLQEQFELFKAEFRTKEETLAIEKAKLEKDLNTQVKTLTGERDTWKNRYESTEVNRAITDAASSGDAYRAEHILAILKPMTKMTPTLDSNGKATGELAPRVHYDVDNGASDPKVFTAHDAVAFMKSKPEEYGHLFRTSATGGLGSSNGTGAGTSGKKLDLSKLSPAEYQKLRKENPALIYGN